MKHVDVDQYKYSGYGTGFDRKEVDMSSTTKIDNRKKDILILGKGPTQGLVHTLSAEKMYSINFTKENTKFCSSLHYNVAYSYLFVNGEEIYKFTAKDSEINPYDCA